ncbi:MAG: sugar phosphate isomerase/epimerase family protein [Planctomycetota bacterium]
MRFAFSKPTRGEDDTRTLFTRFGGIGYDGLQLKAGQYVPYLNEPGRFRDEWGRHDGVASALIAGGGLDPGGVARLREVFAFGEAVGSEMVVFCHGTPREGLTPDDIRGFARELSELGKEARGRDLKLSLHNHYGQPVMRREDIEVFFDAVEGGAVGLTLDTAHLVKSGVDDVAGVIRDFGRVIDNFHLKDLAGGSFRVLGDGGIDFAPVFAAIREIAYDGWVSTDEESGAELLGAMEHCLRFMTVGLG